MAIRKMTQADINRMIKLRKAGAGTTHIARELGFNVATIIRQLENRGINHRDLRKKKHFHKIPSNTADDKIAQSKAFFKMRHAIKMKTVEGLMRGLP